MCVVDVFGCAGGQPAITLEEAQALPPLDADIKCALLLCVCCVLSDCADGRWCVSVSVECAFMG